ncbi:hypothetical protein VTK73DRAFT_5062 [Phialemonium thermophilum]|uniref:Zn(2)-C6 fungal-type domain-containing protein n=1 Tax=Phialemonium thermophilum TaxID=223376 RepID=A0ABR3WQ52_9PEZI
MSLPIPDEILIRKQSTCLARSSGIARTRRHAMSTSLAAGDQPAANSSSEEGPSRKRVRVSRACDACRRRKERCDGAQPSCQRCAAVGRPCSYNPFRKRGLRTGYVKGTEVLLGLLICSYEDAEDLILSVLQHGCRSQTRSPVAVTSAAPTSTSLLDTWRKSAALERLQKALVTSDLEEDEEFYLQNLDERLTSAFNALPRQNENENTTERERQLPRSETAIDDDPLIERVTPPTSNPPGGPVQAVKRHEPRHTTSAGDELILPNDWPRLLEIYLSSTHSWFPVIPKHVLLRTASLLASKCGDSSNWGLQESPTGGEVFSLWASLALASRQLPEPKVIQDTSTNAPAATGDRTSDLTSDQIYTLARRIATQDPESYDVGHVHGFLILTLIDISRSRLEEAWFWVGRAVYTAVSLGLLPSVSQETSSDGPCDGSGKRLLLGCFILDTLVSASLGRRPYMNWSDLQRAGDVPLDGLEEWEPWRPVLDPVAETPTYQNLGAPGRVFSVFHHFGYLVGLLNKLYHLRFDGAAATHCRVLLNDLKQRVKTIYTLMPAAAPTVWHGMVAPHLMHLHMATAATYILIESTVPRLKLGSTRGKDEESVKDNTATAAAACTSSQGDTDEALPASLVETLAFLRSTSPLSPTFDVAQSPPTLAILIHLLEQSKTSCSGLPPPRNCTHPKQVNGCRQLLSSAGLSREPGISFISEAIGRPLLSSSDIQPPDVQAENPQTQRHGVPSGQLQPLTSEDGSRQQPLIAETLSQPTMQPPHQPLPPSRPRNRDRPFAADGTIGAPATGSPISETMDPNELFNQLALLDAADWQVSSADFVEHLGLSHEGSYIDFNSLFS